MRFCVMTSDSAKRYLAAVDAGESPTPAEFQEVKGSGAHVDVGRLDRMGADLRKLMKGFPKQLKSRDPEGGRFEQAACEIVHRHLKGFDREVVANLEFWTWVAVVRFADIVQWRFGGTEARVKLENYGIGGLSDQRENLFFRLWLRADLASDPESDEPYKLAKTGDQDLWRSHILRQGYANARDVARALLRLQAGQLRVKRLTVDGIRELAKRLRRLRANVIFEYLSPKSAEHLVVELCAGLPKAQ